MLPKCSCKPGRKDCLHCCKTLCTVVMHPRMVCEQRASHVEMASLCHLLQSFPVDSNMKLPSDCTHCQKPWALLVGPALTRSSQAALGPACHDANFDWVATSKQAAHRTEPCMQALAGACKLAALKALLFTPSRLLPSHLKPKSPAALLPMASPTDTSPQVICLVACPSCAAASPQASEAFAPGTLNNSRAASRAPPKRRRVISPRASTANAAAPRSSDLLCGNRGW